MLHNKLEYCFNICIYFALMFTKSETDSPFPTNNVMLICPLYDDVTAKRRGRIMQALSYTWVWKQGWEKHATHCNSVVMPTIVGYPQLVFQQSLLLVPHKRVSDSFDCNSFGSWTLELHTCSHILLSLLSLAGSMWILGSCHQKKSFLFESISVFRTQI